MFLSLASLFTTSNMVFKRKPATCTRCQTIMYPGPTGSSDNHKRGYCADGVRQKVKPDSNDGLLPEWPQPHGIFTNGTHFHPMNFLLKIREVFDKVLNKEITEGDYSMEDQAFSRLLASRIIQEEGRCLFRLYDLEITDNRNIITDLVVTIDGVRYLRIDCLQN